MRPIRAVAAAAGSAALVLAVARPALAWQEAHQIGDDATVHVDAAGVAVVEHRVRWHVVRGPLKSIDLVNVDTAAVLEPEVTVTGEDGRALEAHAERHDGRTVHIVTAQPRTLMRGDFTFDVLWRVDLAATRALARDGSTWRLAWSAPVATDGFDAATTVFEVPAAPDPPVAIVADTGAVDDGAVASLRRDPGTDVLSLVRPHVARGEAPVWTLRLDPRALPLVADPTLRQPSEAKAPAEPDRLRDAGLVAGLAALGVLFALLVHRRARAFARACADREAKPRALLPLGDMPRAILAGVALAGAVGLQVTGRGTLAAACVALATLAAALRAPAGRIPVRGPGRWLALTPEHAFAGAPGPRASGLLATAAAIGAVVTAAVVAGRFDPDGPWLAAIDGVALLPLLLTGRRSQLPPHAATTSAPWLARLFARLRRTPTLRVSPWARIPDASPAPTPDELRLLVLPRAAMPGVLGVEVGLAWSHSPTGWVGTPEVLARVLDGSAAATRLAREVPAARVVPGRRPEERVMRLVPRTPTRGHAAALVRSLADALTDRRVVLGTKAEWKGQERRAPARPPRADASAPASAAACSL
ncbi:MAG TPA: hypothetical protein VF765_00895 [Polyangiaceae bacterium]